MNAYSTSLLESDKQSIVEECLRQKDRAEKAEEELAEIRKAHGLLDDEPQAIGKTLAEFTIDRVRNLGKQRDEARARVAELEAENERMQEGIKDGCVLALDNLELIKRAEKAEARVNELEAAARGGLKIAEHVRDVLETEGFESLHDLVKELKVTKAERDTLQQQLAERDAVIEGVARCRDRCTDSTEPTMPVYRDDLTLYRELDKIYTLVNGHNQRTRRPHPAERGRR